MRKRLIILLLVSILIILGFYYIYTTAQYNNSIDNILVFRINDDLNYDLKSLPIPKYLHMEMSETYNEANLLLFQSLNKIENILPKISLPKNIHSIYAFKGIDDIANKANLAMKIRNVKPDLIPKSYILYNVSDLYQLKNDMNGSKYFIFKKNVQQQEGLYITKDVNDINKLYKNYYVIAQEILQDPLIIANRKVNIRIYILIISFKGNTKFYMFNDGFMYYSPSEWQPNTDSYDINITTGLKDRKIYEDNPLTYKDLQTHLGKEKALILNNNIENAMKTVKECFGNIISRKNKWMRCKCFQIMGCDIAPDSKLGVKIMEINKGPDLRFKDARDGALKQNLTSDSFNLVLTNEKSERLKEI